MGINYANNSIKNRGSEASGENKKEIKKVVKGTAKKKKKSELSKITSSIISEEAKSIKEYAVYEVIIPVIKDTITQLIKGSIDMLFYGEVRSSSASRRGSSINASKVSYRDFYDDRGTDRRDVRRAATRYSYDDIEFDSKEDANEVLNRMDEIIEQYGVVTVADVFDLAGVTGNGYTDQNYGWTTTRSAEVARNRIGMYYLKLPRPSAIK